MAAVVKRRLEAFAARMTLRTATVGAAAWFLALSFAAAPVPAIPDWVQGWANWLDQVTLPLVFVPLTMLVSRLQGEQTRATVHERHDKTHATLNVLHRRIMRIEQGA